MTHAAAKPEKTYFFQLHQIAVACDLHPTSAHAFRLAATLAHSAEAEITAIHVIPPIPNVLDDVLFPYAALGADRHDFEAELLDVARAKLLALTDPIMKELADGDEIYAHILHGDVVERTREALQRTSAELLFIGATSGRSSASAAYELGSRAAKLAASALRPVLLVRDTAAPARPRKILAAIDLSSASVELLNYAVSFALTFGRENPDAPTPRLDLVTVIPDPARLDPADLISEASPSRSALGQIRKRAQAKAERLRQDLYIPFPLQDDADTLGYEHHLPFGDPVEAILELVEERDIDTLIIASQHPDTPNSRRLGRHAEALLRRAGCAVLVVPVHLLRRADPTAA